jgi:hypothetical protein
MKLNNGMDIKTTLITWRNLQTSYMVSIVNSDNIVQQEMAHNVQAKRRCEPPLWLTPFCGGEQWSEHRVVVSCVRWFMVTAKDEGYCHLSI